MTQTTVPPACVLAHNVPGRHRDDCTGYAPQPDDDAGEPAERKPCTGCIPARAADGLHACRWHIGRLTRALGDAPDLIAHLHELIEPGSPAGEERVTRGELAPPAPLSVDALSAADDLTAVLGSWAARVATERRLVAFQAPGEATSRRTRQAGDVTAAVQRLIAHQTHTLTAPWTPAYIRDITTEVALIRNRWPLEERPVFLPVPCPACGASSLARWAPRWVGAPTTIACELDDCRTVVDEDRYPWLVRLAADLARERKP